MKKQLTIFLLVSFFLSTVGMPISMHYCEMQKISSLSNCEVCEEDYAVETTSCCTDETDFPIQIKSDNSMNCCEVKIIDASVKDNFISSSINEQTEVLNFYAMVGNDIIFPTVDTGKVLFEFNDSSPPYFTNNIYLINSSFLI